MTQSGKTMIQLLENLLKKRGFKIEITIFVLSTFLAACNSKRDKWFKYGDYFVEGGVKIRNEDTVFDGEVKFYDHEKKLVTLSHYNNNELEGASVEYFSNGIVRSKAGYLKDKLHGIVSTYDSIGYPISKANYFYGLQCGPQVDYLGSFDSLFTFSNLENYPLYTCEYRGDSTILETGNILTYVTSWVVEGGIQKIYLFLYVLEPPHKQLTYKIFDKNLQSGDSVIIKEIGSKDGFLCHLLLDKPKPNHKYLFNVSAYYPRSNFTIENIIEENRREILIH